jgi:hypothetical protein
MSRTRTSHMKSFLTICLKYIRSSALLLIVMCNVYHEMILNNYKYYTLLGLNQIKEPEYKVHTVSRSISFPPRELIKMS